MFFCLYLRTRQTLRHAIPLQLHHTLCAHLDSDLCYLRHSHHLILYSHPASSQIPAFSSCLFSWHAPHTRPHPHPRSPGLPRLTSHVQSCLIPFVPFCVSPSLLKSKVYFLALRFLLSLVSSLWARGRRRRILFFYPGALSQMPCGAKQ